MQVVLPIVLAHASSAFRSSVDRRGQKGPCPRDFVIWYFPVNVYLSFELLKRNVTTVGLPGKNRFGRPLEKPLLPPMEKNPSDAHG